MMSVNHFTDEQVAMLRANPYVDRASNKAITYSEAFKKHFINERNNGKLPSEIFRNAGFDTTVLGRKRIGGFSERIQKMNEREEGFTDLRAQNPGRSRTRELTQTEEISYLKHQVALQKQQIEALKKTNTLNRKAAQALRKKNSHSSKH
jgi:hypothetical protein